VWLEPGKDRAWTTAEAAALTLAGQALAQSLQTAGEAGPVWGAQMEQAARQRRLEEAALVTRRLAHDYGNVLTSILGFTELSLAQAPGETPLKRYLGEIHRAVQVGAQLTNRLRLFARRPAPSGQAVRVSDILATEQSRAAAGGRTCS
jgi:signal transduction histidine kinase